MAQIAGLGRMLPDHVEPLTLSDAEQKRRHPPPLSRSLKPRQDASNVFAHRYVCVAERQNDNPSKGLSSHVQDAIGKGDGSR